MLSFEDDLPLQASHSAFPYAAPVASATSDSAQRRVNAQDWVNHLGKSGFPRTQVLRIPGIYAIDREGGTPRERLLRGTPVLQAKEDVYTNHIHADDLARATVLAMWRGKPLRPMNICDQANMKMGD